MGPSPDLTRTILLIPIAALLVVGGILGVFWVRRWLHREERYDQFSLHDLRELRARGEITETEFQRLRAALLGQLDRSNAERKDDPPAGSP
jgi:uncharacterized membrane protein